MIKVNSRDAGKGRVTCTITGPNGQEIPDVKVIENPDGTFDIIWTCPAAGNYEVDLRFGGVSLTGGPITIFVSPYTSHILSLHTSICTTVSSTTSISNTTSILTRKSRNSASLSRIVTVIMNSNLV